MKFKFVIWHKKHEWGEDKELVFETKEHNNSEEATIEMNQWGKEQGIYLYNKDKYTIYRQDIVRTLGDLEKEFSPYMDIINKANSHKDN